MFATNFHFKEILEWFDDSSFEYLLLFLPSSDTKDRKIDDYIIRNQASIDKLTGNNIAYISYTNMDFSNEIQHVKKHQLPPNAIRTHVYISDEVCDYYSFGQYKLPALILISKQLEYKLFPITKETDLDTYFAPIGIITSFLQDYYRVKSNKDRYKSLDNDKKWRVEECTRLKEGNHLLEDTILEFKRDNQLASRIDSNYCRLFNYLKAKKVKQNTFENVFKDNLDENDIINKLSLLGLDKELNVYALELISDLKKVRNFKKFQAQYGNVTQQIERLINLCAQEINSNTERIEKLTTEISDIEREQLIAPEMLKKYDEELNDIIAIWGKKLNSTLLVDNGTEILSNALNHYSSVLIDILSMANEKLKSNNANDKHIEESGDDRLIRNKEYDIFISYSRLDAEDVHPFISMIDKKLKIKCWIDLDGIETGSQFEDKIISAIDNCKIVLFMLSDNSLKSEWTKREVYYAEGEKKKIVPVVFDKRGLRGWFKFHFGNLDYVDANKQEHVLKLINNLKTWLNMDLPLLHPVKINDLYGLADDEQNVVIKGTWLSVGRFNEGIAFAQSIDGKHGLINHFGQVVIPYQWIHVDDFYDGIARVQAADKKYGFVNNRGEIITNCIWNSAEHFSDGMACVVSAQKSGFIDCTGELVVPYYDGKMTSFSEGLACVSDKNGKWGYINKKGDLVIPYTWEKASPFHTGLARVIIKDLYGYINKKGQYEFPLDWSDSELIPVQDPETYMWGYVNNKGKVMIPFEWVSARPFSEGLARVEKNGVYGFIDCSGNLVIPRRFLEAGDFKDGYAEIKDCVETRCKYVDKDGNLI